MRSLFRFTFLLLMLGTLCSCRAQPAAPNGESLRCSNDQDCAVFGETWRCTANICAPNGLPRVDPFAPLLVTVGDTFESPVPRVFDAEGDDIDLTWEQLEGPPVLSGPVGSEGFSAVASEPGAYIFVLSAADDFGESPPTVFQVIAEPPQGAIYVWDQALADEECGAFDRPCQNLSDAFARNTGGAVIVIAASNRVEGYAHCLDVSNGVVSGGFEPESWVFRPEFISRSVITCDDRAGHRVAGDATLQGVTLATSATTGPLITVQLSGTPTLRSVDIEAGLCEGCVTAGGLSVSASPTLEGVNVSGRVDIRTPPTNFAGLVFVGGSPILRGSTLTRSPGDNERGNVTINTPVTNAAVGVLGVRSTIDAEGIAISGGALPPQTNGMEIREGSLSLRNSVVELSAFAGRVLQGVVGTFCSESECGCDIFSTGCTAPSAPSSNDLDITGSHIAVLDSDSPFGSQVCLASAVSYRGPWSGRLESSTVSVGRGINSAYGLLTTPSMTAAGPALEVINSTFEILEASTNPGCAEVIDTYRNDVPLPATGFTGLALYDADDSVIWGNTVSVDAHETRAVGFSSDQSERVLVEQNSIVVGEGATVVGADAVGMSLGPHDPAELSSFRRNVVTVADSSVGTGGGGAAVGVAAEARYSFGPLEPAWDIEHNFLYAGAVPHSVGYRVLESLSPSGWPQLLHNTIVAEGLPSGGTSSAVRVSNIIIGITIDIGDFRFNYLHAGRSGGRRFIFDGIITEEASSHEGNIATLETGAGGADPIAIVANSTNGMYVLDRQGLEIAYAATDSMATELSEYRFRGAIFPVPIARRPEGAVFVGPRSFGGEDSVLMFADATSIQVYDVPQLSRISLSATVNLVRPDGSSLRPTTIIMGEIDGVSPADIVFMDDVPADCVAGTGPTLWFARGEGSGFDDPTPLLGPLCDFVSLRQSQSLAAVISGDTLTIAIAGQNIPIPLPSAIAAIPFKDHDNLPLTSQSIPGAQNWLGIADEFYVFRNVILGDGSTPVERVAMESAACAGEAPTLMLVRPWSDDPSSPYHPTKVAVGCPNGAVEIFGYHEANDRMEIAATIAPPSATSGPVRMVRPLSPTGAATVRLGVLWDGDKTLGIFDYDEATGTTSPRGTTQMVASAAVANQGDFSATLADSDYSSGEFTTGVCALARDQPGADPLDLHLDSSATDCIDAAPSSEIDDIDGCTSRTSNPDVGADEVQSVGSPCSAP